MSLAGYVNCRCWQDGLTAPPPVDPRLIVLKHGGVRLRLPERYEQEHDAFDKWTRVACRHEGMYQVFEDVGRTGLANLASTLETMGQASFPILCVELRCSTYGHRVPAERATGAREELRFFAASAPEVHDFLVNAPGEDDLGYVPLPYTIAPPPARQRVARTVAGESTGVLSAVATLLRLIRASTETGNPIVWC